MAFEYFRDRFVAEAGDPVAAGSQAFITYGRQGSDRLLQVAIAAFSLEMLLNLTAARALACTNHTAAFRKTHVK